MPGTDDQAERRLLQDFLLGRLPDADAEGVAAQIAADPRAETLARDLGETDLLLQAARDTASAEPPADPPPLRELMGRLVKLRPTGSTTGIPDSIYATVGPGHATTLAELAFLRPAQTGDELGRLAGFRILEVLGQGGMGLVFRAEDMQLRRQLALKVIKPDYAANPNYRERFLREARAAAALEHDHVMPVHQIGEDNGVLFLAMPLLKGETLEARLARGTPLPLAEQLRIGREIALGLAAAHAAGQIHRDIKPSNIWLETRSTGGPPVSSRSTGGPPVSSRSTGGPPVSSRSTGGPPVSDKDTGGPPVLREERVKILDFGLALPVAGTDPLTQTGALMGTPAYMSPEQADGGRVDGRSDLFSLGCVLYRMATGKQPFTRDTLTATLRAVADHTPAPPVDVAADVPPPLSELIVRLLAKSPGDRPASATVTADALRSIEQGDGTTTDYRPLRRTKIRRRTVTAALVTAALLGTAALVGLGMWVLLTRGPASSPTTATAAPAYNGYVDVTVWRTVAGIPRRLRLTDDGALPLRPGDQYRIEVRVTPKAYLYLFRISTEGEADPIYPWRPGQWGSRPTEESPRDELSLPPTEGRGYTIKGDKGGMETWVLLARSSPLDADEAAVRGWFADGTPQRPVQDSRSAVWFENGRVVHNDPQIKRDPQVFEESNINDPVLRMQDLLRQRLQPHAAYTAAVSYARQGK